MTNQTMDIEVYSQFSPYFYSDDLSELLAQHIRSCEFNTFLDCGCGDGVLLRILLKNGYLGNKKIFALDLSQNRVNLTKTLDPNIVAFVDNAEVMETIADNSIDFFVSTQVIEHVDDKKMVSNIYRVVRSGGLIYLSTVFKRWYGWYFYRCNGRWALDPTHLREYRHDAELLDLFATDKFELLEAKKTLIKYPLIDFFIKRLGIKNRDFYNNRLLKLLRKIKVPILGYYNWEIILKKY